MNDSNDRAQATWHHIARFYDYFRNCHEGYEFLKPFRGFVVIVGQSPFAQRLYASQSHLRLVISAVEHYAERLEHPCVVVWPSDGEVQISFNTPKSKWDDEISWIPLDGAIETLEPLLRRLLQG